MDYRCYVFSVDAEASRFIIRAMEETEAYRVLGKKVRELRLELGLSQEQLASIAKLHRTYIGAIERGERNLSLQNIIRLAKALNTTPSALLESI